MGINERVFIDEQQMASALKTLAKPDSQVKQDEQGTGSSTLGA